MLFFGPFVHDIDPVIGTILGVHLWWYGLSYSLGFLNANFFLGRHRYALGLSMTAIYDLSIMLAAGVLIGGRVVEVVFYELQFYRDNPGLIPALWLGGMASHGLLLGGLAGVWLFCSMHKKPFLQMTDALAIPASFILGAGRIGNFIDGQIVGSMTDVSWAVKFPVAEGFRHPVVIYDGLKNLLIIPVLWYVGRKRLPSGFVTGLFLFLYSFLRIFVDIFREYPTSLFGLGTGQVLNFLTTLAGLSLMTISFWSGNNWKGPLSAATDVEAYGSGEPGRWRPFVFVLILVFSLTIPSDWTQDIPARYGARHSGLKHSVLYPKIYNPY